MSPIFDWLVDLVEGIGDAIGSIFGGIGDAIVSEIFDVFLQWIYGIIYNAIADFFSMMGQLGAQIFDLPWVQACIRLFSLFAWALFATGTVVAVFDVAVEYQSGKANIKSCALNVLKGFFAASLFSVVPIQLYRFAITLQNTFSGDLTASMLVPPQETCRCSAGRCWLRTSCQWPTSSQACCSSALWSPLPTA